MRNWTAFILFAAILLSACSGQGSFTFDAKTNTPTLVQSKNVSPTAVATSFRNAIPTATVVKTPAASTASTPSTEVEEQPPSPGGQETAADRLPAEIVVLIQAQVAGQTMAGAPRIFLVPVSETQIEAQYTQQLKDRGWETVSTSAGPIGKAKVMVMQKGKIRAHLIFATQSSSETFIYVLTTKA